MSRKSIEIAPESAGRIVRKIDEIRKPFGGNTGRTSRRHNAIFSVVSVLRGAVRRESKHRSYSEEQWCIGSFAKSDKKKSTKEKGTIVLPISLLLYTKRSLTLMCNDASLGLQDSCTGMITRIVGVGLHKQ
jgi:hypothetical protein